MTNIDGRNVNIVEMWNEIYCNCASIVVSGDRKMSESGERNLQQKVVQQYEAQCKVYL